MDVNPKAVRWFPAPQRRTAPAVRLFAFPYAGGAASSFQSWRKLLPDFIELRAAQLPGRELRFSEPPVSDWRLMVSDAAAAIVEFHAAPIILFGHSMGSMLAFEVARSLRREHGIEVDALVVSGHCAPQLKPRSPSVHHLEGRQLLERLGELYGAVPREALDEPELIDLMAHVAKADLTLSATYRYVEESPLNCPIQVFGGKSDPWVNADELAQWNRQTTGPFNATLLSGSHFYLQDQMMERILLTRLIYVCESSRKR